MVLPHKSTDTYVVSSILAQVPVSAEVGATPASATPQQQGTPSVGSPRPPAAPQTGTELPRTGFSVLAFLALAVLLICLGRLLVHHTKKEVLA